VPDTVGGKPLIVTYCSVCRTGRVFEPVVNGKQEKFRLVGMDHFNAMFEDASTGSWWRQVNGEAIAGKCKSQFLPEYPSQQLTVEKWFELYPDGKVMQSDESFMHVYDSLARFEQGLSTGDLTRTDSIPWNDKSWVVGIETHGLSKAYAWNDLKSSRMIQDTLGDVSIFIVLSEDEQSFAAFEIPENMKFTLQGDVMYSDSMAFDFNGRHLTTTSPSLKRIQAYQEFWHSWRTFHPDTRQYAGSH
jgi:hypothetical protein